MAMSSTLEPIAFDLETTGLTIDDHVTVAGFAFPLGARLFLNGGGREVDPHSLESRLEAASDQSVTVSVHPDEPALLDALGTFVPETIARRDYFLTAYNGERWRSGFDLPFLRTRLQSHQMNWPFASVPYADLMPLFERRFRTVGPSGESVADLDSVYERVIGGPLSVLDPFEDSEAATTAFDEGEFEQLLAHNLADVLRTDRLASVAQRYCARSDFDLKSLTPAVSHPER